MTHNMQDKSFSIGSLKGEDGDVYGRYYGSDGEEGGYQVMSEDITSLRDGLSGLEGNLYGERNVLSKQSSKLENTSGVGPITKKSHSHVKRIDGQTPKLKGEEGDASDKYYGLKGQEGGYIGILEDITSLRDGFSGLDGDPNGKDNILSSHGSESEVVGKISPKVKGLHKDLKKMNGQTKRLKDQKGGSQVVFGGRSILKGKLKGKEGDFDGQSDVLSGRTKGPKNQKDKSLGISGFGSYIKGKLSGLEGNSYGQPDVLKGKTHGLPGKEGELSGQKGEPQVALGGYSGLSRLKGDEGDSYDQSDGLSGKTLGLPGQDSVSLGVSPGISRAQPDLRDKLSGLEGDINGQHNVLGSKSSEFEITGGITPKMNISYDSMKGESGQAQILKYEEDGFNSQYDVLSGRTKGLPGQKGESQAVLGGSSGLRSSLKGEEGNSYGQPDVLKGKTHGLPGKEGELRDKIHRLPDQKGELQVALGGYSGLSRLKGSEGDSYDQSDGLKGKTLGLKGQEGVSPGISRGHPNLKDKLSGLEGDLSGQHNVLSSKSSEFEITGGISPKINMSYDTVKGISGQAQILKDEEDSFNSQYDVLSGRTKGLPGQKGESQVVLGGSSGLRSSLKGDEGNSYGQPDVLKGKTHGLSGKEGELIGQKGGSQAALGGYSDLSRLKGEEGDANGKYYGMKGQEGGYLGILEDITSLRNGFPGLNGGSNGKHNALSIQGSESEIIGGILPRIKMLYDSIKGISGQSQILKGEEGDVDGHHDVLIGRTKGLKGKEGDINGQRNILSSKSSEFKIIGGINPQIQMLQDSMKGTKDRTKRFADQEDGPQVVFGGVSDLSRLKGEEGDANGKYYGMKGQEGGYLGISEDITSLRDGFPVTKGYPNGKDNVLSVQGSVSEIISGITPKINISYDSIKGISGQSQILKGEEGDVDGKHDILIGRKTGFKGKEGDINGQHNVLSRKSSEFEITGGISPKINMSYDTVKGISGQAQILKYEEDSFNGQYDALGGRTKGLAGQKGESQAVLGGSSDLKGRLKGAEGDSYDQSTGLSGKTLGLSAQEGELIGKKGEHQVALRGYSDLSRLKGEEGDANGKYYGMKGQEGGYLGILEDITSLRDGFPGLNRGSNGKHNTLSRKSSESEILGGILPRIKMLYDSIKGISGQTYELPGQEGDVGGHHDVLIGRTKGLKGKEGDINGQRNILSSKSSEFKIIGGINPQIQMLQDSMKGTKHRTKRFADQEDGPQVVFGGVSGLSGLKGEEGDINGKYDGLKGQEGGYLGISEDITSLRDGFPITKGGPNGNDNVLSIQGSVSEIIGGITPKMNISYDSMKGISGQAQILKYEEDSFNSQYDVLSGQTKGLSGQKGESQAALWGYSDSKGKLSGLEGNSYGQSDGLSGKTLGLPGQDGVSLGISGGHPNLRDNLSGLEGDLSGQHNVLSINNSGLEITGGITPKMNLSYDSVKGISGQSQILKGEEGDFNGKHDILIGRTKGLKGKEGDINGQRNILSSKSSEFEIIGGMNPQIKILQDDMKGTKRRTRRFADQEDGSQVVCMCFPGLRNRLKGEEGDINGKYYGLKGQEGGYLGILEDITSLRGRFPVIKGGINGKDNVLSSQNIGLEIIGGISPKINMSYDTVKGISGQSQILKGEEGDFNGKHDVLIGRKTGFKGKEGDINGQHNVLSRKNSEFEITGGITPKMNISYDSMKGESGQAQILKYEEDGFNSQYDVLSRRTKGLKGEEGDFYGQSDGFKGKTYGLPGQEGELTDLAHEFKDEDGSVYIEDYLSHFTIESQSISTTTEENTNLSQNFPILLTINPLEDSTSGSNSDSTPILTLGSNPTLNSDSNSFSNFGNKITYIVVAFISFFIILGVSYKVNNKTIRK